MIMDAIIKIWDWFKKATKKVELFRLFNLILWIYLPIYSFEKSFGSIVSNGKEDSVLFIYRNITNDDLVLFVSWCICIILVVFGIKLLFIKFFSSNFFQANYFIRFIIPVNYRFAFKQLINNSVKDNIAGMKELMELADKKGISTDSLKEIHLYVDMIIKLIAIIAVSGNYIEFPKLIVSSVAIFLLFGLLMIFLRDLTIISGVRNLKDRYDKIIS